jgi:threonine synthase
LLGHGQNAQSLVSHLECSLTGTTYKAGEIDGLSAAGRPLLVRYDLKTMAGRFQGRH